MASRTTMACLATSSRFVLSRSTRTCATRKAGLALGLRYYQTTGVKREQQANVGAKRDPAPKVVRGESKLYKDADAAVADIQSGATILSAGFGLCGTPETLIAAIHRRGADGLNNLTAVTNNGGTATGGGLSPLVENGQISKLIMSFLGANKALESRYLGGQVGVELCPQGTLAERIRSAGAGIPAFFTPTGVNTYIQHGQIPIRLGKDESGKQITLQEGNKRETREFNGKTYNMEYALPGDIAIIRAWKVDKTGNCVFRYSTKAFGNIMGKAAKITIVEAENIVEVGEIDPQDVHLPGIYVNRIIPATVKSQIETRNLKQSADSGKEKSESQLRRERIAKRTAKELKPGYYVNLGIGVPTLAPSYLPPDSKVWIQSENGILGMGEYPTEETIDGDIINAGKETVTLVPGASCFDSSDSFAMIRGGHVDVSVLGALQVSANGDLANYYIPGQVMKGMGGAMDLVSNPDNTKIVVATDHVDKKGRAKIVQDCKLPLTGARCVSTIITDLCVFEVDRKNGGLTLTELYPGVDVEEIKSKTDATFKVADNIKSMEDK